MRDIYVHTKDYIAHHIEGLRRCQHRTQRAVVFAHASYGGAVFIEGHGVYPVIALVLGVLVVVEYMSE